MDFRLVVFLAASAGLVYISWPVLRTVRSYGFYRFFAIESALILILYNLDDWFRNPFSPSQIISWICLALSIFMALHGYLMLCLAGAPMGSFENTSSLVRRGAYRYIRHPMYASLLWLGLGAFLKAPSVVAVILLAALLFFLFVTARAEEAKNLARFGQDYVDYMRTTKRFIPFVL